MHPRYFRATAFLCLAIVALDAVVAQLPHTHRHLTADGCVSTCEHQHSGCSHSHTAKSTCSHSHGCARSHSRCEHTCSSPAQSPTNQDDPCDHCSLCRHQSQAALPCTAAPVSLVCIFCELLPDQRDAQIVSVTPLVYRGRGPPGVF